MNKKLLFLLIIPFVGYSQVQIGQDINGKSPNEWSGYSVSLSANGDVLALGATKNNNNQNASGCIRVFQNISGNWMQIGQDLNGSILLGGTGYDVSLSSDGKIIAIGSPFNANGTNSAGNVKVYQNILGNWVQLGLDILGKIAGNNFGYSVSVSGDGSILAVSAPYATGKGGQNSGKVSIYRNISGTWTQMGSDIDDGELIGEFSGFDIDLSEDGNTLAVGTLRSAVGSNAKGKVRIYRNIAGTWTKIGNDIVGENAYDTSSSVSLSANGNVVAIGAPNNNGNGKESGSVRVYHNNSGNWTKIGQDIDGENAGDMSGILSLSGDGNTVVIGAPYNMGNFSKSGHVRIYKNISGTWLKLGNDISGKEAGENSGYSVAISSDGNKVAIGAYRNSSNGSMSGTARVYDIKNLLSNNEFVQQNFNIYPNPTSDVLNISLENNLVLEHVTIYNNLGQVVKTATENVIDVSHLAKGLYFVEVTTNQGKATKKVVVQ